MTLKRNTLFSMAEVLFNGLGLFLIYKNVVSVLGIHMLGVWSIVLATTAFGRMADVGISAGMVRFLAREHARGDTEAADAHLQTGLISIAVLMGALTILAYWPFHYALAIALHGEELAEARRLVPYALTTFWLLNINAVTAAALLGLHRADLRSVSNITGMVAQVAASLLLVRGYQLMGLAWAQAGQYVLAIALSWSFLHRVQPTLPWVPTTFSWASFKELIGFGAKLQIGTIANLLFEPLSKIILGHVAGTATLGLFEMAYRMVYQVRGVAIGALQNLVPAFTLLHETDPAGLTRLFRKASRLGGMLGAGAMAGLALAAPIVAILWIGHSEPGFVRLTAMLAVCWCGNILSAPSYFLGMATGAVGANVAGQVLSGLLSPTAGYVLGSLWGGEAAVFGVLTGKVIGDVLPVIFNRPTRDPKVAIGLYLPILAFFLACSLVSVAVYVWYA